MKGAPFGFAAKMLFDWPSLVTYYLSHALFSKFPALPSKEMTLVNIQSHCFHPLPVSDIGQLALCKRAKHPRRFGGSSDDIRRP